MKNLITLVLAGGDSSRLWPLSDKHFIKFFDKPLIYQTLLQLVKFGFSQIVIVTNKDNKESFVRISREWKNVSWEFVEQTDQRGMAGAVISAKKYIDQKPVLIIGPTDIHENILYSDFANLVKIGSEAILAGTTLNQYFPGGYLTVKDNYVIDLVEKPEPSKRPSNIVNFVFDYFKDVNLLIDEIEQIKTTKDNIYEQAIAGLIKKGVKFRFLPYKGYWGYLKYPWHILSLMEYYLGKITERKIKNVQIDRSSNISGNVFIEEGARVMENAKIVGPSYIGSGTIIGTNCLIRESMIGNDCVIGFGSEITRSYIGNNSWLHRNFVGDSVLDENVSMGAGAVTANLKLNEQHVNTFINGKKTGSGRNRLGAIIGSNVRIGINASIMPGTKIGKNSHVGAGVVLDADLPDDKFCTLSSSYKIVENKFTLDVNVREEALKTLRK